MHMPRLVGRNVRRHRLSKGWTQEQLAEQSGFSQQYVSNLERGVKNPTVGSLWVLAQALGITPVDLIVPDEEAEKD